MEIVLFNNVRAVIKAEKVIRNGGFACNVRPVPTTITSECGMCLEVSAKEKDNIVNLLTANHFDYILHELTD